MASRDELLARVRASAPPAVPLPDLSRLGVRYADPVAQFCESLAGIGGVAVRVPDLAAADAALRALPVHATARRIVSLVPGLGASTEDPRAVTDPHAFEGLDLTVLPGDLAVAENGAVWIDGRNLPHRALFVVPEHVVCCVRAEDVVNDMHEAYARLAGRTPGYGTFLAGPSKTADIEQSLVIGAQGARSATVYVIG